MTVLLLSLLAQDLQDAGDLGLRVARGFRVTTFSDHALANDLYCMTFDSRGRVVVSSQHWIKRLHDDDGDGRADRAEELAKTGNGAMGLCFVGNDLYASVDGGVRLFRDPDGDGRFDGPSELLFKLSGGEHGVHAIRQGPDGRMYVVAGNDAKVTKEHVTTDASPVRDPEAGALIRFSADGRQREILAHGFRNPYDFDFNAAGDVFTYDSDCERDYFLPWYTPTRLYHVAIGMHHGWRLPGWMRSYARRDYQVDTVPMLVAVGRGSPTGVVVYRHAAFPERYRGGVFYADWTFGKVYFTPLIPEGASYKPGLVEIFLQPAGTEGFAPTDLAVAPDGALFVSIGGRRTRGAVYRIAPEKPETAPLVEPSPPARPAPDPAHPELRVRQAAALAGRTDGDSPQARLTAALAAVWRGERPVEAVVAALKASTTPELRLQAVRLLQLCLGDTNLAKPVVEVHSDYAPVRAPDPSMLPAVRPLFPSGDERLDLEASRLLAMLEDDDPATVAKTAAFLTKDSHPTRDVHYLIVLSRLKGAWPDGLAPRAAAAMLELSRKLEGLEMRPKQVWGTRLGELVAIFARRPGFADALLAHPAFVSPAHVDLATALEGPSRDAAARLYLAASSRPDFAWSEPLVALLSGLPPDDLHPALRRQWSNYGLRDAILGHLARRPDPSDRDKFLTGLESANPQIVAVALKAIEALPRPEDPRDLVPLLKLVRRLSLEPKPSKIRPQAEAELARQMGIEPLDGYAAYAACFLRAHPSLKGELEGGADPAALREQLSKVPWDQGDVARGAEVFRARGCQTCHAAQGALGPALAGAASRFSREDLFEAIANPSKDVAPPYRTTAFQTRSGDVYTGIVAFDSADGYIVQTGATTTVRLPTSEIAGMKPASLSLMPNDLLKGLSERDLADLYAYLRSLK